MPAMLCQCQSMGLGSTGSAQGKVWLHVLASLQGCRYPGLDAGLCTIPMPEWMKKAAAGCRLTPTSSSPHHLCPARTGQGRADPPNPPGGLKWEITPWGGGCTPRGLIREALLGEQSPLSLTCPLQPPAGGMGGSVVEVQRGGCVPIAPRPLGHSPGTGTARPGRLEPATSWK